MTNATLNSVSEDSLDSISHTTPLVDEPSAQDPILLERGKHPLEVFFRPQTVAVIGASERESSPGRTIFENLAQENFGGTLYAVNPTHKQVFGFDAYSSITEVPATVELAIIVTPAKTVPGIISECIAAGVKGAVVISAGFRERGEEGKALEQEIAKRIKGTQLRVIGPNCLGVMNPVTGMNATFARKLALPGSVGFISQSGALCTAILDWSLGEVLGFSSFISIGSMLDVGWGDLIDYLGSDPHTESIVIYMESIGDARSFLSAAREVALRKPIIVIKAGRTEAAAQAAASHTGAMTGSDDVLDAAFKRVGVLRVNSVSDLFHMAEVLAKQPRPKGKRLAIVTNAGGPGVLAADALMAGDGELAKLSQPTMDKLNELLPPHWSHGNPIDVLADATEETYERALELAVRDPNTDGVLAITAPLVAARPLTMAKSIAKYAKLGKPVVAAFMGGSEVHDADALMSRGGVPTFDFPDQAARIFNYMWRYSYNLRSLYETPSDVRVDHLSNDTIGNDKSVAVSIIEKARKTNRTLLNEFESKQLLAAYGIPVAQTIVTKSPEEAITAAKQIGYPVVAKLVSKTITHKSDVGGVQLDLRSPDDVRRAFNEIKERVLVGFSPADFEGVSIQPMILRDGYELILGSSIDPQFGPVLLFGAGGVFVEVFKDRVLGLPPLNTTLARRMMEQTRIWKALEGARGRKGVDRAALEKLLVAFSQLVIEHPSIKEIDINPLHASAEGLIALDARVVLHPVTVEDSELPKPAIRPYPTQYVEGWKLTDGEEVVIRPIRPEDEPAMVRFHHTLSERSVYYRYVQPIELSQRTAHERLTRICFIDYDREIALVAETQTSSGLKDILGVGRLRHVRPTSQGTASSEAVCAVIVSDAYQNQGLGTELLRRLLDIAKKEGIRKIHAQMLPENEEIISIALKQGFHVVERTEKDIVRAELDLEL